MKKENTIIVALAVLAAIIAATWLALVAPAFTGNEINMTKGVTQQSADHFDLHMIVLWICVVIGIGVFTVMFMEDSSGAEMTVKITGFQWRWKYEYLDQDISFISSLALSSNTARQLDSGVAPESVDNYLLDVDNPLVLPVGKKIKFLITADDVIHSWWVPALGWKRDAIPGFVNEAWTNIEKPGTYRGQCAELCGKDHGFMPIVVIALPEDEFEAWVNEQLAGTPKNDKQVTVR